MPSIGGYHPYGLASILTGLESNRACVGYAWPTNCSPSTPSHLSTLPQDQNDNLIPSMPRRYLCCFGGSSTPEDPPYRGAINLWIAQTSFRWCNVVVRREGVSSGVVLIT
ncbi:uncharacterized protein TNCV_3559061 [Trichonephila clavipes]|uniref:Uncharacterized protein n=1 Tax=Trichonephila clavipes TaxID=2585209 RepID=A0A8X6WCJ1_TRICX|nr:uncharacterized protein TNCV_3559061 [Trichonephila clavipes]